MNIIWTVITVVSLAALAVKNPQSVVTVCVESGGQALSVALSLCGVYCLWLGIFNVAQECRLPEKLAQLLQPINKFLYGNISDAASQYISLNLASNLLGVGNAATPSAISAIKETEHGEKLSFAGTMLFVVNACGVQLVPTTVIGMRATFGSVAAADILLPNLFTTAVTCTVGVGLVFAFEKSPRKRIVARTCSKKI